MARRVADALASLHGERERLREAQARARLERERDHARADARLLQEEVTSLTQRIAVLEHLSNVSDVPPAWVTRRPGKGKLHHGMLTLLLSDCHFDEVVRPGEVEGANKYDRAIAVKRLCKVFEGTVQLARHYYRGIHYDGVTVFLLGDMLSGTIHEELTETNADAIYGSLDFWTDQLVAFLNGLADEFGSVHCAGVVGNHGRRTRKPRAKQRAKDNLDWLMYRTVARLTGKRVSWTIPEGADVDVPIYNTVYKLTHGDQFRGGGGISGLMAPLMLGHHRKARRQQALGRRFDWLCMGHWHEYIHGRGLIVNGSTKGYDEYAYVNNYVPERAQQALFITTPEHGCSFASPVFADDRKAEGW